MTEPKPCVVCNSPPVYRDLLKKYMAYVLDCEGKDYVSTGYRGYPGDQSFYDHEWAELRRVADEVLATRR